MSQTQVQLGFVGDNVVTETQIAAGSVTTAKLDSTVSGALVPIGGIIMWSGVNIPSSWALCNGQTVNGQKTPNLQDKFIVGAGSAYAVAATGGYTDATLPSHTHTVTASTEGSTLPNVSPVTFLSFFISILRIPRYNPGNPPAFPSLPPSNNDAINGIAEGGNFGSGTPENSVSRGSLNSVGDPVIAGKNLPPYYALAFIMRVS